MGRDHGWSGGGGGGGPSAAPWTVRTRVAEGRPTFQAGPSGLTFRPEPGLKGHLLKMWLDY